jgi:hypothetical protein
MEKTAMVKFAYELGCKVALDRSIDPKYLIGPWASDVDQAQLGNAAGGMASLLMGAGTVGGPLGAAALAPEGRRGDAAAGALKGGLGGLIGGSLLGALLRHATKSNMDTRMLSDLLTDIGGGIGSHLGVKRQMETGSVY